MPAGRLSTPPDLGFRVWALKDSRSETFATKHTYFHGGNVRCAGFAAGAVMSCRVCRVFLCIRHGSS